MGSKKGNTTNRFSSRSTPTPASAADVRTRHHGAATNAILPPSKISTPIWAPQPQAWPRALAGADAPAITRNLFRSLVIGAVGDKSKNRSGSGGDAILNLNLRADAHVEQLLRTLNLNLPEPATAGSSAGSTSAGSIHNIRSGGVAPAAFGFIIANANPSAVSVSTANTPSISTNVSFDLSLLNSTSSSDFLIPSLINSGSAVSYAQSPDFSPLSLSSAPLDSPRVPPLAAAALARA
ncbi:hypothetical protein B0H19DRAFT_1383529 [Mycena capillaripes]|nr:hypothetical protein B0H19DRAFT_1383529 [Mycena capillaripes]